MEDNAKEEYIEYAKALLLWGQIKTDKHFFTCFTM